MTTIRQVQALRLESREAGDWLQRIVCDIALDEHEASSVDDYTSAESKWECKRLAEILAMTQAQAWSECARMIANTEAQS